MTYITPHQWACINLAIDLGYFGPGKNDTGRIQTIWVWMISGHGKKKRVKAKNVRYLEKHGWERCAAPL